LKETLFNHHVNRINGCHRDAFLGVTGNKLIARNLYFNLAHIRGITEIFPFSIDSFCGDMYEMFQENDVKYFVGEFEIYIDDGDKLVVKG
jgi:hypothetical protein